MKIIFTIFFLSLLSCSSKKQNDYLDFNTLDEVISYANKSENLPIDAYVLNDIIVTKDSMRDFITQPKKRKLKQIIALNDPFEKRSDGKALRVLIVMSR